MRTAWTKHGSPHPEIANVIHRYGHAGAHTFQVVDVPYGNQRKNVPRITGVHLASLIIVIVTLILTIAAIAYTIWCVR